MPIISSADPRLTWTGTLSLETTSNATKPWRIPHQDLDLFSPGVSELAGRAEMPSGVRLRFATNARALTVACEPFAENGNFDLVINNEIVATAAFAAGVSRPGCLDDDMLMRLADAIAALESNGACFQA